VLIEDWKRLHLAGRRASYAAEAVRAQHCAFADALDDAVEGAWTGRPSCAPWMP
jgi:hypothetical protein